MNRLKTLAVATGLAASAFLLSAASAEAYDHRVVVVNASSQNMLEFHASRVGINSWQEDILGEDVLHSGYHTTINIEDGSGGCYYDFKAVMADGRVVYKSDVNVCYVTSWTVYDSD